MWHSIVLSDDQETESNPKQPLCHIQQKMCARLELFEMMDTLQKKKLVWKLVHFYYCIIIINVIIIIIGLWD